MLKVIVLLALIFSTVGVTVTSCACPKMPVKQTACSHCKKERTEKTDASGSSCCSYGKHLVLKNDYQKPLEFQPLLTIAIAFSSSPIEQKAHSGFAFLNPVTPITAFPQRPVEKCALLSTFLI